MMNRQLLKIFVNAENPNVFHKPQIFGADGELVILTILATTAKRQNIAPKLKHHAALLIACRRISVSGNSLCL